MGAPTRDETIARLTEYQDQLDAARSKGAAAYLAVFRDSPAGIGVHEIDADKVIRRVSSSTGSSPTRAARWWASGPS